MVEKFVGNTDFLIVFFVTIFQHEWFFSSWDVDNEVPTDRQQEIQAPSTSGTETQVSGSVDEGTFPSDGSS